MCLTKNYCVLILESKIFQSSYGNSGFQLTSLFCLSLPPSYVSELFFHQPSPCGPKATTIPLRPALLTPYWAP